MYRILLKSILFHFMSMLIKCDILSIKKYNSKEKVSIIHCWIITCKNKVSVTICVCCYFPILATSDTKAMIDNHTLYVDLYAIFLRRIARCCLHDLVIEREGNDELYVVTLFFEIRSRKALRAISLAIIMQLLINH